MRFLKALMLICALPLSSHGQNTDQESKLLNVFMAKNSPAILYLSFAQNEPKTSVDEPRTKLYRIRLELDQDSRKFKITRSWVKTLDPKGNLEDPARLAAKAMTIANRDSQAGEQMEFSDAQMSQELGVRVLDHEFPPGFETHFFQSTLQRSNYISVSEARAWLRASLDSESKISLAKTLGVTPLDDGAVDPAVKASPVPASLSPGVKILEETTQATNWLKFLTGSFAANLKKISDHFPDEDILEVANYLKKPVKDGLPPPILVPIFQRFDWKAHPRQIYDRRDTTMIDFLDSIISKDPKELEATLKHLLNSGSQDLPFIKPMIQSIRDAVIELKKQEMAHELLRDRTKPRCPK